MVVTELEMNIKQASKRRIDRPGKYRLDANGNQGTSEKVLYARSEIYLSEVLENICDKSMEWTMVIHPSTGKGVYARRASLSLKQVTDGPTMVQLGEACSDFLDNYEDQLIKFTSDERDEPVREFCHKTIKVCTAVDVTPLPENLVNNGDDADSKNLETDATEEQTDHEEELPDDTKNDEL